jgi:hypothetical protein
MRALEGRTQVRFLATPVVYGICCRLFTPAAIADWLALESYDRSS